ncbi:MAG: DUF4160 domain-containing protein [Methylomonas sp.]|jgi:hypothetical protein
MPELARFFGIIIYMNWRDHNPPLIHASYGEHEALVGLNGKVLNGSLPNRALSLVFEWLMIHHDELLEDWELAQQRKPLNTIEPLE